MKGGLWFWLTIGLLIGLAVSPRTSWVTQNHADYLFRDSRKALWDNPGWPSEPTNLLLPKNWTATEPYRPLFVGEISPEYLAEGLEAAPTLDRPEVACGILLRRYNKQKLEVAYRPLLLEIAKLGQRSAPDNAYFWIEEFSFLAKTDPGDARKALLTASQKSDFDEYGHEESQMAVRLVEGTFGFRGHFIRLMCASGVSYPHFGRFLQALPNYDPKIDQSAVTKAFEPPPVKDVELREALIRISDLMQRRSRSAIGVLVSNRVLSAALGTLPFGRDMDVLDADLRRKAAAAGPLALATAERVIRTRTIPLGPPDYEQLDRLLEEPRGWLGGALLLSLLLLATGASSSRDLGAKVSGWWAFTPHLALMAALPFFGPNGQTVLLAGTIIATGVGAWRTWVGTFVALLTFALALSMEPISPVAPLSILLWVLARSRWGRTPWAVSIAVAGVALGLSAVIKPLELMTFPLFPIWLVVSGIALMLLAARSTPKPISFAPIAACVALAYAGLVVREIHADDQMNRATREFLMEADRRRGLIGLPSILNDSSNMKM